MPDKHIELCYTSLLPGLLLHANRLSTHEINVESLKTVFKRKKQETSRRITVKVQRKLCFRSAPWLRTEYRLNGIPGEQKHTKHIAIPGLVQYKDYLTISRYCHVVERT